MIRLFTALEIPHMIGQRLQALQRGLEGARWIDPENFHITLRFIGDISEDVAADVDEALQGISFAPFMLSLSGVGEFGGKKPHSVFARVEPSAALSELQSRHEAALRRLHLPTDPRKFTPHVTLARSRGLDTASVYHYIEANNLFATQAFEVSRFVLFSSRTGTGGGPYVAERIYPDPEFAPRDD